MSNPYSPPQLEEKTDTLRRSFPVLSFLGMVFGTLQILAAAYFVVRIVYLHLEYPGLSDPSPGMDAYWPEVVVFIYWVLAGILALIGVPLFMYSFFATRRGRNVTPKKASERNASPI